jgi:group I intron endonuclease
MQFNIYKITNLVNGKVYVGQTTRTIERRFSEHLWECENKKSKNYNSPLNRALRKYGENNFILELIDTAKNGDDLNSLEQYWIFAEKSYVGYRVGYNADHGGNNRFGIKINTPRTKESREKMSDMFKGKFLGGKKAILRTKEVNSIPIIEITSGNKFASATDAAKFYNTSVPVISAILRGKIRTMKNGLSFEYQDMSLAEEYRKVRKKIKGHEKQIFCVELNKVFNSIKEATQYIGAARNSISNCLVGRSNTAKKLHFKYI